MGFRIRRAEYYYCTVKDQPGAAFELLDNLAELGINLLAFTAIPIGPANTQLTLFPEDNILFEEVAERANLSVEGPHHAFLVSGRDELGALASVHKKLYEANINVYASNGVSDGRGSYGYVIYVRPKKYEAAAKALNI